MKKAFILSSLVVLVFSVNVFAQNQLSAKQLFMSLPNEYVNAKAKERVAFLAFPKSVKSDFLTFMITENAVPSSLADGFRVPQAIGDLKAFRGSSSTVVGLRYQISDDKQADATVDTTRIVTVLLENKSGKWTNVTDTLLPKVSVDDAYKILTENFQLKDIKKEDVWLETQISKYKNGLTVFARVKGSDSITALKFYKWTGANFVESVEN